MRGDDEIRYGWEPPKIDRKRGIVYFSCPEWIDCDECPMHCALNPHCNPADFVAYEDIHIPPALWMLGGDG
ncbi:hypothetical protein ES703_41659 [subsurface metagenome]